MNVHRLITLLLSSYVFTSCKVHPNPHWAAEMDDTRVNGISWFEYILWFLPIALLWGYFMAFRRECYDRKSNQSTIDKGYHSGIFGDSFIVWLCWYSYSFSRLCYCCSFSKLIGMINVHYLCANNKHCKKIMFLIFKY